MHARTATSFAFSLCVYVVTAACVSRRPPVPLVVPVRSVAPAVARAEPLRPPDAVLLVGHPRDDWRLVNHTPVAVTPAPHLWFTVEFERLGFDGRWLSPLRIFNCISGGGYLPIGGPLAPGASRQVFPPNLIADDSLTAGTWRAFVVYSDPRHPSFPSRASAVFDVVGLDAGQAEAVLSIVADRERRACLSFELVAQAFARTAPLSLLPRLLELTDETVAEREEALVAITSVTGDATVLTRAMYEVSPSARLSAARVVIQTRVDDERLLLFAASVMFERVTTDAPIEVADVYALSALVPRWTPDVLPRVLQRVEREPVREVRVALLLTLTDHAPNFTRWELERIRATLLRAVSRERDAVLRDGYRRAARACAQALREPGFGSMVESGIDAQNAEGTWTPDRCEGVLTSLEPMLRLARGTDRMTFVPRDGELPR